MGRDRRAYLWDVLEAIRHIEAFTAGKELQEYKAELMLRSAVERQFEIIGEALRQAIHHFPEIESRLTQYRQIIAFRNRLIHGYGLVSDEVVWGVIESGLPVLKREAEALLAEYEKGES